MLVWYATTNIIYTYVILQKYTLQHWAGSVRIRLSATDLETIFWMVNTMVRDVPDLAITTFSFTFRWQQDRYRLHEMIVHSEASSSGAKYAPQYLRNLVIWHAKLLFCSMVSCSSNGHSLALLSLWHKLVIFSSQSRLLVHTAFREKSVLNCRCRQSPSKFTSDTHNSLITLASQILLHSYCLLLVVYSGSSPVLPWLHRVHH